MIRKVVDFALSHSLLTGLLALILFIAGLIAFHALPIEAYPEVANNYVEVSAPYVKALQAPLPHIPLIASLGVSVLTVGGFILAGAAAVGIGAELVPQEAMRVRRDAQIGELAQRFLDKIAEARAEKLRLRS